jgi:hypothetical protein
MKEGSEQAQQEPPGSPEPDQVSCRLLVSEQAFATVTIERVFRRRFVDRVGLAAGSDRRGHV